MFWKFLSLGIAFGRQVSVGLPQLLSKLSFALHKGSLSPILEEPPAQVEPCFSRSGPGLVAVYLGLRE